MDVEVPTYLTGILEMDNGAVGTLFTTFDVVYKEQARFEIYGSEGTLLVPDPNMFGERVYLLRPEAGEYMEMPLLFDYKDNFRGLGLADMAVALRNKRPIRANLEQLLHVLDVLTAFERSSEKQSGRNPFPLYARRPWRKPGFWNHRQLAVKLQRHGRRGSEDRLYRLDMVDSPSG